MRPKRRHRKERRGVECSTSTSRTQGREGGSRWGRGWRWLVGENEPSSRALARRGTEHQADFDGDAPRRTRPTLTRSGCGRSARSAGSRRSLASTTYCPRATASLASSREVRTASGRPRPARDATLKDNLGGMSCSPLTLVARDDSKPL